MKHWAMFFFLSFSLAALADGLQTHTAVVKGVRESAHRLGFDIEKYSAMLDKTAAALIDQKPDLGTQYPIWVIPSRPYPEMYSRDSFWTLSGYWHGGFLRTYVDIFSDNAQDTNWNPLLNGQIPRFVRKHVPAPTDGRGIDESTMFWILGAKLAGKNVTSEPYLNLAHTWLKSLVTPDGLTMFSHGWIDAWNYPITAPVVSANNQGLYAVSLRALRDMGVAVTPEEIHAADTAYRNLMGGGYLRAYRGSNVVDVSSLMGEALALYLWDESILSTEMVKGTVSHFAEVFYSDGPFLGYKCLSNPDGSYLDPDQFLEIAERDPGNYQNGGSWLLYEALALYAAARHGDAVEPHYTDRLIERLQSEVRYEYSSKEFICTGGTCGTCNSTGCFCPNGKCGVGAFNLGRSGYGWNLFVRRLVLNREMFGR